GLGEEAIFDREKLIPDGRLSIAEGGIAPLSKMRTKWFLAVMSALGKRYDFSIDDPISSLSEEAFSAIINGDSDPVAIDMHALYGAHGVQMVAWQGITQYIESNTEEGTRGTGAKWLGQFIEHKPCSVCGGSRLKSEALQFRIGGKNIAEVSDMSIEELREWALSVPNELNNKERIIAREILKEISDRLGFLCDVGLGYLSLSRPSRSLSGGESQRIRLATQVGSKLVNVLYILDEPSIGLHQRDNRRLIDSLKNLRDEGNSVIVVEHDEEMMRSADWIVDMGPLAGRKGGEVVAEGTFEDIVKASSLTADYLSGRRTIATPAVRRTGNGTSLRIIGARGNNLKNVSVEIPLGMMVCITGVSGSGKSTLINETLHPYLSRTLYRSFDQPLPFERIEGVENIDKLVVVDQSPIGRSPRSNPATYANVFADIRKLFEKTPDAQVRGFGAGRFSFNVKGGRCEECKGAGVQTIEMNFLPDVYVTCKACGGHRYNRETLEVKYKGKNIDEVLGMTINQAAEFFENIPKIYTKLHAIREVGLGYLKLGQSCTTLSGGESQRIKLAAELAGKDTGRALYIFDEPTTGLHFEDIRQLLAVFRKLVDRGNSVVIIEHNLDVIKCADWIIDMGPEGGKAGGSIVAEGIPEQVARIPESHTGKFLAEVL
ncbi:MAG: excinuclease ABC subunit UvrA, partial [Tidjanibacter sp.]|nr:excinuclease ABC subunit UvrA [Tidjanibacter sp.]